MIADVQLRWVIACALVVSAAMTLIRLRLGRRPSAVVDATADLLALAAMGLMTWPGAQPEASVQLVVFSACGAWFAGFALFDARSREEVRRSWYHASVMIAMVVMAVLGHAESGNAGHGSDVGMPGGRWHHVLALAGVSYFVVAVIWFAWSLLLRLARAVPPEPPSRWADLTAGLLHGGVMAALFVALT